MSLTHRISLLVALFAALAVAQGPGVQPGMSGTPASGAGSGNVTSSTLTSNTIPKATGAATLGNSSITDNGTTVSTAENISVTGGSAITARTVANDLQAFNLNGAVAAINAYSGGTIGWSSTSNAGVAPDTAFSRDSPGVVDIGTGGAGSSAGTAKLAATIQSGGTQSISGCSLTSATGGVSTGQFAAGATSCTAVVTLPTAAHGWWCSAVDITTGADLLRMSANSTTSCTFTGTVVSSDVIVWHAVGY